MDESLRPAPPLALDRPRPSRAFAMTLTLVLTLALPGFADHLTGPGSTDGQLSAQTPDRGEVRVGLTLGGTGFLGVVGEYRRGDWSGELTLGTISFREIAVAASGKRYFAEGSFRPAVGLGLWSLTAWTEDGSGSILLLRAPFAVDWNITGGHHGGLEVAMNRALMVNRLDPEDDTPPNRAIVPIPGAYYRFGWSP